VGTSNTLLPYSRYGRSDPGKTMYCPRCGQQQVSDEMRFCSRCGMALTGLMEWLGASLPQKPADATKPPLSPRQKGIRRGLKVMFAGGALFPLFLIISIAEDAAEPMIFPFFVFFAGVVVTLYSRLFGDKTAPAIQQSAPQTTHLGPMPQRSSLPPPSINSMHGVATQQVRTNELAQPASVTENTTRLLDNE
jgi:zinc-ribbon domain